MWLADTAKYAVPHRFQYRIYARQAWVRLQDLNDVSAVADRYRLQKGKRRRNRSTTARSLARRSSALGERVVESAVGARRGEHGGLIGVECGVWTVGFTASDREHRRRCRPGTRSSPSCIATDAHFGWLPTPASLEEGHCVNN